MSSILSVIRSVVIFLAIAVTSDAATGFKVTIDTSKAPECQAFADKSKMLVEEWFPRINDLLFGPGHPLPATEITLIFEPMKGVAHVTNNVMHVSAEWVTKKAPNDYGMIVHELTHIVQDYRGKGEGWLTEGIADYIRDRHFEPGVRKQRIDPEKNNYRQGYGVAATFLIWLEERKNKDVVRTLNLASHDGKYAPEMWRQICGAELDALWKEFVETWGGQAK